MRRKMKGMYRKAHFFIGILFMAGLCRSLAAEDSDSIAYVRMKVKLPVCDSLRPLLEAADALAGAGLFTDALDILQKQGPIADDTIQQRKRHSDRWRISTGVDYYHLEDIDTAIMTIEELQDYRRLTQTPLSLWARVHFGEKSTLENVERIAADIYMSSYKGRLEMPLKMQFARRQVSLETIGKAEKWFQADASGEMPFDPFHAQPSDMGGFSLRTILASVEDNHANPAWSFPLSIDGEWYRTDRPGYESHASYRFSPALEYRRCQSSPFLTRITGEARYDDYYRTQSDSLDVTRFFAYLENSFSRSPYLINMSIQWSADRFRKAIAPRNIDRWDASARAEYKALERITPRMSVKGIHEREIYGTSDGSGEFSLRGTELTFRPSIRCVLTEMITLEPEVLWQRRWADLVSADSTDRYLWNVYKAWEPGLRIAFVHDRADLSVRASWRAEDIDALFEGFTADSRWIKAGAEGCVSLFSMIMVNLLVDYQYRRYAPYLSAGRVSENIAVSGGITANF